MNHEIAQSDDPRKSLKRDDINEKGTLNEAPATLPVFLKKFRDELADIQVLSYKIRLKAEYLLNTLEEFENRKVICSEFSETIGGMIARLREILALEKTRKGEITANPVGTGTSLWQLRLEGKTAVNTGDAIVSLLQKCQDEARTYIKRRARKRWLQKLESRRIERNGFLSDMEAQAFLRNGNFFGHALALLSHARIPLQNTII